MSSLLSAENVRLCPPTIYPHGLPTLIQHCHKTSASLVDAGILPRNGIFQQATSQGFGESPPPTPQSQVPLCCNTWPFALTSPAFRFHPLCLRCFPSIFFITCLCKVHVTNEKTEAQRRKVSLCQPAGPTCSPGQAGHRAFCEQGLSSFLSESVSCLPPVSATSLQSELGLFHTCPDPSFPPQLLAPGHWVQLCGLCTVQYQGVMSSTNGTPWSCTALCPSQHPYPYWLPAGPLGDLGLVNCTGEIHGPLNHLPPGG